MMIKIKNKINLNQQLTIVILLKEEEEKFKKLPMKNLKIKKNAMNIKLSSKRRNLKNYKKEAIKILVEISRNKKLLNAIR